MDDLKYISSYIKYIYFNVDELQDDKYLMDLSKRIKDSMPNSNFVSGNLNFYINNYVSQEMRTKNSESYSIYQSLKNYIYLAIEYYRMFYGKNIRNQDVVIREVMKKITNKYSYSDVLEGVCESEIEALIENQPDIKFEPKDEITQKTGVIDDKVYIMKYVQDYLRNSNGIFEFKGDMEASINLICADICRRHIKTEDILAGEYDYVIDTYIRKEMFGLQFTSSFREIYHEVSKFVMDNHTYMDIGNIEQNVAEEIYALSKYLVESRYDINSIKSGKCQNIMEGHLRLDCLKANSKICKNSKLEGNKDPNKFFLNSNQIFDSIKKPIVLAVALGIIGTSVAFANTNNYSSHRETIKVFDTYDYPDIPYTMSNEFADTLEHIVDYYDDYGEGYGQICLYRAYQSINGREREKTYAMDIMIGLIKSRTQYNDDMQMLYTDVKPYQSYVEYVYDRIKDNPKIDDSIYSRAVRTYASQVANYKELNPFSLLNSDEQKAIKNMMNLYDKYIEDLELEFNRLVNEREK